MARCIWQHACPTKSPSYRQGSSHTVTADKSREKCWFLPLVWCLWHSERKLWRTTTRKRLSNKQCICPMERCLQWWASDHDLSKSKSNSGWLLQTVRSKLASSNANNSRIQVGCWVWGFQLELIPGALKSWFISTHWTALFWLSFLALCTLAQERTVQESNEIGGLQWCCSIVHLFAVWTMERCVQQWSRGRLQGQWR